MTRDTASQVYVSKGGYTNQGYALSLVLHVGIVAFAWTGLPFFHHDIPKEAPLIVDLVPIEDITSAAPKPAPPSPDPQPVIPDPPKPLPVAESPPADSTPPPPPKPEVVKKEPDKAPPVPQVKPPPPKPTPPKAKQDDAAMLEKLLKDMQKTQPKPQQQAAATTKAPPSNNVAPNISDHASMTELDAIRRHIEGCWRIDPGKEGIENLAVEIKVFINPDGSVQKADILDMARYFTDPAFRTFANSARNAVLGCGNIPITPAHYNELKEIDMNFSPQGRIN